VTLPAVSFRHLARMTDDVGLLEHAEGIVPRYEHGYCVDDVARALVVVSREAEPTDQLVVLARRYLYFLLQAQESDGRIHNRLGYDRRWHDLANVEDCWGRAVWAFGVGAVRGATTDIRAQSLSSFDIALRTRSPYPQAMAFAALGAAALLDAVPGHAGALTLLADAAAVIGRPSTDPAWPWPMARLSYANAAVAEALIAAGSKLGDAALLSDGLRMLGWLLDIETRSGHLSVTPVGGRGPGGKERGFDQQPIEVAALADACVRAASLDDDPKWLAGLQMCIGWFLGDNDSKTAMFDPVSGGGCDGLMVGGRNRNQGAESTMALVSVLQHAHELQRRQELALAAR
jgi:hypothetical protein